MDSRPADTVPDAPPVEPTHPGKLPLSVFIIAQDEADRIGPVIAAAQAVADEIVVVDSGSTDGTPAVAEGEGARVVHNAWPGFGRQKRFGEQQCRHLWLLNLDADEVIPEKLASEIRALFATPGGPALDGYSMAFAEVFPGERAPHPLAYAHRYVRLYRRDRGSFSPSPVHDVVEMRPAARIGSLRTLVPHFSVRSLGDQMAKLHRYSDQQADDLEARGIRIPTWRVFVEFQAGFWKAYIGRRHALRGVYGFLTAMNYAISRHMRLAKHYERRRRGTSRPTSGGADPSQVAVIDPSQAKP